MKNITSIVLVGLIIFLLMDRAGFIGEHSPKGPDTTIVRDTVWHETSKTVVREVAQVGGDEGYIPPGKDMYIAPEAYDSLLTKFNTLVKELTARKFYKDSLQLDSVGYIVVKDTVQFNSLQKRSYNYFYKIPHVTETMTITKYAPPVRQFYIGGGFGANNVHGGLLYKTKKDLMFGVYVSPPLQQNSLQYGFQTYWKIKLKK
jgi:hypothetical protein